MTQTNSGLDQVAMDAKGGSTAVRRERRWTFGAVVAQIVLLSLVGAAGFGSGYLFKDRDDLMGSEQRLQQQLVAQEQIGVLEREVHELKLARSEEKARRATVVEVSLDDVVAQVKEGVARAAVARFDSLAAGINSDLARLVEVDLLERVRTQEREVSASTVPAITVPEDDLLVAVDPTTSEPPRDVIHFQLPAENDTPVEEVIPVEDSNEAEAPGPLASIPLVGPRPLDAGPSQTASTGQDQ